MKKLIIFECIFIIFFILAWNLSKSQGHSLFCVNLLEEIEYHMASIEDNRWYIENADDYKNLWDGKPNNNIKDSYESKKDFINEYLNKNNFLEDKLMRKSVIYKNICD